MKDYSAFYAARDIVSEILRQDFIGPVIKDETLTELPLQYYLMGKLYPKEDITEELDMARNPFLENAAESYDSSISLSNQKNPSSMGITFTVMPGVDRFVVKGSFAVYEPIPFANAIELGIELPEYEDNEKKPKYVWNRVQYDYREVIKLDGESIAEISLPRRAKIKVYINKEFEDSGEKVITVALINDNSAESSDLTEINAQAMFQPVIEVSGENGLPIFTTVERKVNLTTDPELLELDMLYRDTHCYGQGHGCAVVWDLDNEEPLWVRSEFFPSYNLRQMKPSSKASRVFNMKRLFTEPATTRSALRNTVKGSDDAKNIRLISANALFQLVKLVAQSKGETVKKQVFNMLQPKDFFVLDNLVELVFPQTDDEIPDVEEPDEDSDSKHDMFHPEIVPSEENLKTDDVKPSVELLPDPSMKIGQFIKAAMENLAASGYVFSDEEMQLLCQPDAMNKVIGMQRNMPFFLIYSEGVDHRRYYAKPLTFGKYKVFLNAQLYEGDRAPFITWFKKHL